MIVLIFLAVVWVVFVVRGIKEAWPLDDNDPNF